MKMLSAGDISGKSIAKVDIFAKFDTNIPFDKATFMHRGEGKQTSSDIEGFYCPICGRIPSKFMPVVPNDDSLFHPLLLVEVPFYRRCLHLFPPAVEDMGNFLLAAIFCFKNGTESYLIKASDVSPIV